jgi:phosphatidylserine/phosphatidylglycerophosphate/cardiolipin synthase-like enzyme
VNGRALTQLSRAQLERLLQAVRGRILRCPIEASQLAAIGLHRLADKLGPLAGQSDAVVEALLEVALAERARHAERALELVWTGPKVAAATSRDTGVIVEGLFRKAQREVLIAGYAFYNADQIFAPLHQAMAERGVQCSIFLHVDAIAGATSAEAHVAREVEAFLRYSWPFEGARPRLFYMPESLDPSARKSLHAKCVVVDERWSLVGSANFTDRAQTRNIEVGALIDDGGFARDLVAQLRASVAAGVFREV